MLMFGLSHVYFTDPYVRGCRAEEKEGKPRPNQSPDPTRQDCSSLWDASTGNIDSTPGTSTNLRTQVVAERELCTAGRSGRSGLSRCSDGISRRRDSRTCWERREGQQED